MAVVPTHNRCEDETKFWAHKGTVVLFKFPFLEWKFIKPHYMVILPANAGGIRAAGSIPGLEDPPEEGMATHSSLLAWRVSMDRGAWRATTHEVAKSWTRLKQLRSSSSSSRWSLKKTFLELQLVYNVLVSGL